jgi:hypothetical protein
METLGNTLRGLHFTVVDEPGALPAPVCKTCDNIGFVIIRGYLDGYTNEWVNPQTVNCPDPDCPARQKRSEERYAKLVQKAQIPRDYADLTFARWETLKTQNPEHMVGKQDAYGAALAFVAARERRFMFTMWDVCVAANIDYNPATEVGEKNSLVFAGTNGIGKTSLAAAIAADLLAARVAVLYARTVELLDAIKERFDKQQQMRDFEFDWGSSEQGIISTFQSAPVLILDEFGLESYTPWRREKIQDVVRYRMNHQLPTIFTTNLGYDELASEDVWGKKIGHAVHGMAHWMRMGGYELRRRTGEIVSR